MPQRCVHRCRTTRRAPRCWLARWPTSSTSAICGLLVLDGKDVTGILSALEPVFDPELVVTDTGSPRAMDTELFGVTGRGGLRPGPGGTGGGLPDAIETATALVEEECDGHSGAGIVVTGSSLTAGAARTPVREGLEMTQAAPQTPDPWKSFRGVMAGTDPGGNASCWRCPWCPRSAADRTPWSTAYLLAGAAGSARRGAGPALRALGEPVRYSCSWCSDSSFTRQSVSWA